ncbi:[FeFe] hydrogenase H-cluster maturation GTPase HydF [Alkaliphilus peptidifermentans]|uniref:Iron-only hydrogenase maturation protein HydF n=1 Tax=Alkaliphilus peptidifermentans DSM 18978 TaxID=1120976 RepID=A0A1G5LDA4_9FIRM|nr:[FeFe] hydrogenase H-cluster maturation GTPase HydF [Alkaliphilus peptidifermentans]SCZ10923.1 iron-only hydrogenase maturation protein HydF [Alkaliphilus peptidifermentans DSM 18978]
MNQTPRGNRLHIAIFGRRNAGKSSLINALTDQDIALVSDVAGTTTDPVYKSMEILPIGPVLIIDTAGIDDEGNIGELRVQKTKEVINKTDVAIIVVDHRTGLSKWEIELLDLLKGKNIPMVIVENKIDLKGNSDEPVYNLEDNIPIVKTSAKLKEGIDELKNIIIEIAPTFEEKSLLDGLVNPREMVLLVTPIDSAAPKGRMILPQVQVIREILDKGAFMAICRENQVAETIRHLKNPPKLIITDSQAFKEVNEQISDDTPITSFSIIFANHKGDLKYLIDGVKTIEGLQEGSKILIAEACTHHRQKDDIGTVKIPMWLEKITGKKLNFNWVTGTAFPNNLEEYSLIVHCGSCMLNRQEMIYRIDTAKKAVVPMVNYGVLISYVAGILDKAVYPFKLK